MEDGNACTKTELCAKFCALPLDRQMVVVHGALVMAAFFLAVLADGLLFLTGLLGAAMIFGGLTGMCPVRKKLLECSKSSACSTKTDL